jgi:hypothetical protein
MAKDRYFINYARKINGIYTVIQRRRIRPGTKQVSFKKKTYLIDWSKVVMRRGRNYTILIDIDASQIETDNQDSQVTVKTTEDNVSKKLVDVILTESIGTQFVMAMTSGNLAWLQIVVGAAIGIPVGIITGQYVDFGA